MVIWTGWGILAALIWGAFLGLTQLLIDGIYGRGFYTAHMWPKIIASALPAPTIWFVGRAMNGNPDSERRLEYGPRHTLFFIPMEWWGPIFLGIGIVIALVHAKNTGQLRI